MKLVFTALVLVTMACGQKTYRRGCECEYTVDGKCAYTLMVPVDEGRANMNSCPQQEPGGDWTTQVAEVREELLLLQSNVSAIMARDSLQSHMLNVLQNALLKQTLQIQNLSNTVCSDCQRGRSEEGCQQCEALQDVVKQQQSAMEDIQTAYFSQEAMTQWMNTTITSIIEKVESMDSSLTELQSQVEDLSKAMAAENQLLEERIAKLESIPRPCQKRGALITGPDSYVADEQITASSVQNVSTPASRSRINTSQNGDLAGAWCPREPNEPEEWLMFDLGQPKTVFGVVTRGRSDYTQWVTSYKLQYADTLSGNETSWQPFTDVLGAEQIFQGNSDQQTVQTNMLWRAFTARYIRIIPLTAYNNSNKCMRADLIGCVLT